MSRSSSKPRSTISAHATAPPSSVASINDVKPTSSTQRSASFFVLPPQLPTERKALYKPVKESSLLPKIDEIIGEYPEQGVLWYFARYKGGIAHRVCFRLFTAFIVHLNVYI
jgi:chromodomain-helicase-DNA-binding protein 4